MIRLSTGNTIIAYYDLPKVAIMEFMPKSQKQQPGLNT